MDKEAIIKTYSQMGTSAPEGWLPDGSDILDSVVDNGNHLWWVIKNNGTVDVVDAENSFPNFPPQPRIGKRITVTSGTN